MDLGDIISVLCWTFEGQVEEPEQLEQEGGPPEKAIRLEQVQQQVKELKKKQAEDAVEAAKGQVRALAASSSSTDSVVLAVDNLIEVATRYSHPDAVLFRDLRAQAYIPGGPSFSQICLNLLSSSHSGRLHDARKPLNMRRL